MLSLAESSSFKLSSCCWRRSLCSSSDSRLISNSWLIFWRREERERGRKGTRLDEKTDEKNGKDNRTRNWASWLVLDHETRDLFYILPCLKCLCETNSQCMFSIWKCFLPVFLWYKLKVSKKKWGDLKATLLKIQFLPQCGVMAAFERDAGLLNEKKTRELSFTLKRPSLQNIQFL